MDADIFFRLSPYAQCCLTNDLHLIKWNEAFEALTGRKCQASLSFLELVPVGQQGDIHALLSSLPEGQTTEAGLSLQGREGNELLTYWKWYRDTTGIVYAVRLPDPESAALPVIETKEALPSISMESARSLLDESFDMIARFDRQLRYTFVNQKLLDQIESLSQAHFLGKTTQEIARLLGAPEENFTRWTHDLQQVLATGKEVMHYDSLQLESQALHFQTKMFPEFTGGEVTGVLVITRIINELKKTEQKLKEQKTLLKMVFDCMQEGVMVVDTAQEFVLTNHQARVTLPIHLSTKNYTEWARQVESFYADAHTPIPPAELPALKALNGETVHNHLGYYKHTGATEGLFLNVNANPLLNAAGQLIGAVAVFNDVSAEIKAREQVASSLATLKSIIENTQDLVVAIDKEYSILTVNSSARESFKKSTGILIDKDSNLLNVLAGMPAVAQGVQTAWSRALAGESYVILHQSDRMAADVQYFESVYSPIYNQKGEVMGATMIGRNVTLKHQQEDEIKELLQNQLELNQQLEEKNKALLAGEEELHAANEELTSQQEELKQTVEELASRNFELDQLVYKTSHDIRSPLTSILGLANVMKAEKDTSQWPLYLGHIENRVLTLDRFVQSMISYAKANRGVLEVQPVDFTKLVAQTKHDLAYMKGFDRLEITLLHTGEQAEFYGDVFRIQILFNNLISNAIKYQNPYTENPYLHIEIRQTPQQAEITFTDNGIGIKEDHQARIFDMFYRATESTDGSGLGLYIVKQTVERMKGKISLKSQYGQMTQFAVRIPNAYSSEQK